MDRNDIGLTGDERLRPRQDLEERAAIQRALEATPEEADRVAVPLAPPLSDSIHPILPVSVPNVLEQGTLLLSRKSRGCGIRESRGSILCLDLPAIITHHRLNSEIDLS